MAEIKKYEDIPEITDEDLYGKRYRKSDYTYIINAQKYQETGDIEIKRVLKKDLAPEASASYVFFKREGCQGYPLVEADLYLTSSGKKYVGPFQMDKNACNIFLKRMKQEHPEWTKYITHSGVNGYLNFVKECPDKKALLKTIEEYALSPQGYFKDRVATPEILAKGLAQQFQKTDKEGNFDATRIPLHVLASLPTGVIARGNGGKFKAEIPSLTERNIDARCINWISDKKNGAPAYKTLKSIDYLTPEILNQYQTMEFAGADKLIQNYNAFVSMAEESAQLFAEEHRIKTIEPNDAILPNLPDLKTELYGRKLKLDIHIAERGKKRKKKEKQKQTITITPQVMQQMNQRTIE